MRKCPVCGSMASDHIDVCPACYSPLDGASEVSVGTPISMRVNRVLFDVDTLMEGYDEFVLTVGGKQYDVDIEGLARWVVGMFGREADNGIR